MFVLATITDTQRMMHLSKRKKSLQAYIDMADRKGWAWRLHDGNGWADGSPSASLHIQSITQPCMAAIIY